MHTRNALTLAEGYVVTRLYLEKKGKKNCIFCVLKFEDLGESSKV